MALCIVGDITILKILHRLYRCGCQSYSVETGEAGAASAYSPNDVRVVVSDLVVSLSASLFIDLGHFVRWT